MQEWFLTMELIGKPGMPNTPQGVTNKARKENWQKRKPVGVKGRAFEYHILSLPVKTQAHFRHIDGNSNSGTSPGRSYHVAGYGELNREILEQSIEAIEHLCTSKNLTISSQKKAKIIALVYQLSLTGKAVDASVCDDMLQLAS